MAPRPVHLGVRVAVTAAVLVLLVPALGAGPAKVAPGSPPPQRPRIALVLGGGGARGAAHVGVLEVLEELRVPVDFVVGTSMGSIVGGLYASGMSPEQIHDQFLHVAWADVLVAQVPRDWLSFRRREDEVLPLFEFELGIGKDGISVPSGVVTDQALNYLLRSSTLHAANVTDFDDFPIPYRSVAVDLDTGEVIVIGGGDLAEAIRASMAYPGVFSPAEIDGRLLIDGGVIDNLPVDIALAAGADIIIAVDVSSPLRPKNKVPSSIGVVLQSFSIMSKQALTRSRESLRTTDLHLLPDLEGITAFGGWGQIAGAIEAGRRAALQKADELQDLGVSPEAYQAFLERKRLETHVPRWTIGKLAVTGNRRVVSRQIIDRVGSRPGTQLDLDRLQADLQRIYRMGEFDEVQFRMTLVDGTHRLTIEVTERPALWTVRFGARVEANFEGQGDFTAFGYLRRSQINRLGAEWKNVASIGDRDGVTTELFQPLSYSGRWFAAPAARVFRDEEAVFPAAAESAILVQGEGWGAWLDLGVQFGNFAQLRLGYLTDAFRLEDTGITDDPLSSFDTGAIVTSFISDRVDDVNFPTRGNYAFAEAMYATTGLGSTRDFERARMFFGQAFGFGRNALIPVLDAGTGFGSDLPVQRVFALGGFLDLSGLPPNSVYGNVFMLGKVIYRRELFPLPALIGGNLYVGGSVETGNAWFALGDVSLSDVRLAGSVYVAADTMLGPAYLAYGVADGGERSVYLFVGRLFDFAR